MRLAWLALLLVGCEAAVAPGAYCDRAADCAAPLVCARGRCRSACEDSRDCPLPARCLRDPTTGAGVCSIEQVDACARHDCPLGLSCRDGECLDTCSSGAQCLDGVCVAGACVPTRGDAGVAPSDGGVAPVVLTETVTTDADDGEVAEGTLSPQGEASMVIHAGAWTTQMPPTTRAFFRFALSAPIPSGATITGASLSVFGLGRDGTQCTAADELIVVADDVADAPPVGSGADFPGSPSGHAATTMVSWPGLADWSTATLRTTPDLSPIFQQLVDAHGGLAAGAHVRVWIWGTFAHDCEGLINDSSFAGAVPTTLTVAFVP